MGCFMPRELYGIIGWPLGHSLSPLIHNTAFQACGLPAVYMAWPFTEDKLENFVNGMRVLNVRGCSVTIPHKIAILPWLDSISEGASLAGAVNTLFWREDSLCGENTDITGFLAPLENTRLDAMDALLLGAGGAAHAVAAALRLRGCRHTRVASPGNKRQYQLAERFGFEAIPWNMRHDSPAGIVINATPLGMSGAHEAETPYDFAKAPRVENGLAYDLVYNPPQTVFLRGAAKSGRKVISGREMFFWQANAQFHIWTGKNLPRQSRAALDNALNCQKEGAI